MADRPSTRSVAVVALLVCVLLAGCSAAPSDATTNETGSDRTTSTASSTPSTTDDDGGGSSDSATTGRAGTTGTTPVTNATSIAGTADEGEGERTPPSGDTSRSALVTRVIDGDTVEVRYRNGASDRIRLLGVDTPEVSGDVSPDEFEGVPETEAGREHLREWATRASSFAREELEGREVRVVTDPQADRRDRYGRLLAYVVPSGEKGGAEASDRSENGSFNAALLRGGYARMYDSTFGERERYERIEARAQERNVGLWGFDTGNGGRETGTESGSSASGLAIARIEPDAPGDDNDDPNGEYVVFENRGSEVLDLSGWQVSDEGGYTYVFPQGATLAPDARVTLYSGRGVDGENELYWGSSRAIWNNAGDTVTIRDESGSVVAKRSYRSS